MENIQQEHGVDSAHPDCQGVKFVNVSLNSLNPDIVIGARIMKKLPAQSQHLTLRRLLI